MTDKKILEMIAVATAKEVVSEFKRQNLIREGKQTPFQKTEILLYNYNNFKQAISDKYKQIETIRVYGLPKKSASVSSFSSQAIVYKDESDKVDEKIESLEQSIQTTKSFIDVIDSALDTLRDDVYFDIIKLKYFECKGRGEIAEYFQVDASTISRNKNRLVNTLQIRLFSDDVIYQIFSL